VNLIVAALVLATPQLPGEWREDGTPAGVAEEETRAVEVARDGSIWLAVRDRGVARATSGELTWFGEDDGLPSDGIAGLRAARDGSVWASGVGGVSRFGYGGWEPIEWRVRTEPRVVFGVGLDPEGGARWFATSEGAVRVERRRWVVATERDGLPHSVVHAVAVTGDGAVWFACRRGVARDAGGGIERFFLETNFRTVLVDDRQGLWFGTSDGVLHWDGEVWTQELIGRTVYPSVVSEDGTVWAGSAGSGLWSRTADEWGAVDVPARLVGAEIFDVAIARDGSLWLATSAGTARLVNSGDRAPRNESLGFPLGVPST
jgi:ligand-binding sensor domain-containing protein